MGNKSQIHKGGRPAGRTALSTEVIKNDILDILSQGIDNNKEILAAITLKHPGVGIGLIQKTKAEYRELQILSLNLKRQDYYVKDSILEYERLIKNAKIIEDNTSVLKPVTSLEAQKNILETLKQRNSLLGIDKTSPTIEINFQANIDDKEFLS